MAAAQVMQEPREKTTRMDAAAWAAQEPQAEQARGNVGAPHRART